MSIIAQNILSNQSLYRRHSGILLNFCAGQSKWWVLKGWTHKMHTSSPLIYNLSGSLKKLSNRYEKPTHGIFQEGITRLAFSFFMDLRNLLETNGQGTDKVRTRYGQGAENSSNKIQIVSAICAQKIPLNKKKPARFTDKVYSLLAFKFLSATDALRNLFLTEILLPLNIIRLNFKQKYKPKKHNIF